MFVNFSLFLLLISTAVSTVIRIPGKLATYDNSILEPKEAVNASSPWLDHIMDFIDLVDREAVLETVVRFIDDPEAMRFVGFLLSPNFKEIIWEIEAMDEFQEAYIFLKEKGYDMQSVIDFVNAGLNLPPFKPLPSLRYDKGVSGFIAAVTGTLSFEDMRKLFHNKLENSPEFAELCKVMKSKEFMDILNGMLSNKKFSEIKIVFEGYGVDFKFICEILKDVFGVGYNGSLLKKESNTVKTTSFIEPL